MTELKSNERTFQGVLLTTFNKTIENSISFNFARVEQEQNVGISELRLSDTIIYPREDLDLRVLVEPKNSSWEVANEYLG